MPAGCIWRFGSVLGRGVALCPLSFFSPSCLPTCPLALWVPGSKFAMTLGLPVGAIMNCADNSGAKNLYVIAVAGIGARLNRLPAAGTCIANGCLLEATTCLLPSCPVLGFILYNLLWVLFWR